MPDFIRVPKGTKRNVIQLQPCYIFMHLVVSGGEGKAIIRFYRLQKIIDALQEDSSPKLIQKFSSMIFENAISPCLPR